jgi:hypothetical protein
MCLVNLAEDASQIAAEAHAALPHRCEQFRGIRMLGIAKKLISWGKFTAYDFAQK